MKMTAIIGLAGTGKTTRFEEATKKSGPADSDLARTGTIYLSQNSATRESALDRVEPRYHGRYQSIGSFLSRAHTHEPDIPNLPPLGKEEHEMSAKERQAWYTYFRELKSNVIHHLEAGKHLASYGIDCVLIDNFEAVWESDYRLFQLLRKNEGVEVQIAVDPYRLISDYNIEHPYQVVLERVEHFADLLGYDGVDWIWHHYDHRAGSRIHGFIKRLGRGVIDERFDFAGWESKSDITKERKPKLRFFNDNESQYEYLKRELARIEKGTTLVTTWGRRTRNWLRERLVEDGFHISKGLRVETIHKSASLSHDNVFVFDTRFAVHGAEQGSFIHQLLYTASSRSRRRLELLTSQPKHQASWFVELFRDSNDLEVHDSQRIVHSPFRQLPKTTIRGKLNDTKRKRNRSAIDSISMKVSWKNMPFVPSRPPAATFLNEKLPEMSRGYRMVDGVIQWSVKIHKGTFTFEFLDLNPLHRLGFNDRQIVGYCANKVIERFEQRINLSVVEIARIDLCRYDFADLTTRRRSFESFAGAVVAPAGTTFRLVSSGGLNQGFDRKSLQELDLETLSGSTLYLNTKRKRDAVTLAVYDPAEKRNKNRITLGALKYELQLKNYGVKSAGTLRDLSDVESLYAALRANPNALIERFHVIMENTFGFSSRKGMADPVSCS